MFMSSMHKTLHYIGFTSYSCSGRHWRVLKTVMHVQSCCFAYTLSLSWLLKHTSLRGLSHQKLSWILRNH